MSESTSPSSSEYEVETRDRKTGRWLLGGLILLIIGAFIFLRTAPSDVGGVEELAAVLQNGQPKVLEFYSNY